MTEDTFILEGIEPIDFYGVNNKKFHLIQEAYPDVKIVARGIELRTSGENKKLIELNNILHSIINEIRANGNIPNRRVVEILEAKGKTKLAEENVILHGPKGLIVRAKTEGQRDMFQAIQNNDMVFAIGPAGTGKSYTAVALALRALKKKQIKKIVLVRPAVEAGESLGFLPGDMKEKIDPYLRPLYDALEEMLDPEKLKQYLERNIIEIVPLAYMRGRTLNHSFIILDEGQNATQSQIKMFLTRMGMYSKVIVTGDITQIDLPKKSKSGLLLSRKILDGIEGIAFVKLSARDVMRHQIVRNILKAYKKFEDSEKDE